MIDLASYPAFYQRQVAQRRADGRTTGLTRLAHALVEAPETILPELVQSALDLCGADSAGITLEHENDDGTLCYRWEATAGQYEPFQGAVLPGHPNPCNTCLERGRPQLIRVSEPFFHLIGVEAPHVTDGLLLPWVAGGTRGTVWIVAHGRTEAFDRFDLDMMLMLADFAALALSARERQQLQNQEWAATTSAVLVDLLGVRVREPVRKLADLVFTAAHGKCGGDAQSLARQLSDPLETLTRIVEDSFGRSVGGRPN